MIDREIFADDSMYESYVWNTSQLDEIEYDGNRPYLSCEDIVDAHYLICDHFYRKGGGIGGFGPKDVGLLNSAAARQLASVGGEFIYNTSWQIASTLMIGLITNHPFYDANKRTAFLSTVFFLYQNRFIPSVDIEEVEDFTVEIANTHSQTGRHPHVEDVLPRLRAMFRKEDRKQTYIVTYRELRQLLSQHDCSLRNPSGNFIDVFQGEKRLQKLDFRVTRATYREE